MQALDPRIKGSLDGLRESVGCDVSALAVIDRRERLTRWIGASGNRNERYSSIVVGHGQGIEGEAAKVGRGLAWSFEESPKYAGYSILLTERLMSAYVVPVQAAGECVGILLVGDRSNAAYGPEIRGLVAGAAERIAEWLPNLLRWS